MEARAGKQGLRVGLASKVMATLWHLTSHGTSASLFSLSLLLSLSFCTQAPREPELDGIRPPPQPQ